MLNLSYHVYPEQARRELLRRDKNHILKSIIGQDDAIETLVDLAYDALGKSDRCLPVSICFIGGPSTGKTYLSKSFSNLIGTVYVETDASQIRNNDKLIDMILQSWIRYGFKIEPDMIGDTMEMYRLPSTIVFIDEIHGLSRSAQDGLLKATERSDGMLFGKDRVIDCKKFTWIGGTTDWGKLASPFRTRFRPIYLYPYTKEQVCKMLRVKGWEEEVCKEVVHYAGTIPREVKQFCELLEAAAKRNGCKIRDMIEEVARREGIDKWGMRRQRVEILVALSEGKMLLRHLSGKTGIPGEDLLKEWLPSMLATGESPLLSFDGKYELTEAGRKELQKRGLL